jgi:hypothetical protein
MENEQKQFRTIDVEIKKTIIAYIGYMYIFYKEWKLLALCRQKMHGETKDAV